MDYQIDTHFQIWELEKQVAANNWPVPGMHIYNNYSLADYERQSSGTPVKYAVCVQSRNRSTNEALWILKQCKDHPFVKGVVAGVDLESPQVESILDEMQQYPEFVGARHILDLEGVGWILREDVSYGLAQLEKRGLTYDLLLTPRLLQYIPKVVTRFPRLKFVVDHIAKPYIKDGRIEGWKDELAVIAKFPNVYCKLSGMVTEADPKKWKTADFKPYVDHVLDVFGVDRVMYASNWPIHKDANATYDQVHQLATQLTSHLPQEARDKIFRDNAIKFYNLKIGD